MYYLKRKQKTGRGKTDYIKKLDKVFSLYIRLRDAYPNGMFRCISCGQIKPFSQADAGHYFSRTHMNTRYDEDNVNSECRFCNRFKADHLISYRENLIKRIGEQRYDNLEWKSHQTKKWSDFELKELIKYYTILSEKIRKEKGL